MEQNSQCQTARRNQIQSPLLRLSAELRIKIYEYALGGWRICLRRTAEDPDDPSSNVQAKIYAIFSSLDSYWRRTEHIFALTRVCRQVYAESNLIPFSHNEFGGERSDLLRAFDTGFFSSPSGQLITSIRILLPIHGLYGRHDIRNGTLDKIMQALAGLPHLREVAVEWSTPQKMQSEEYARKLSRLVAKVMKEYEVCARLLVSLRREEDSWTHAWKTPELLPQYSIERMGGRCCCGGPLIRFSNRNPQ